jgi:hypothetical protein
MHVALSVIRILERNPLKVTIMNECMRKDYRKICFIGDHQEENGRLPSVYVEDLGLEGGGWESKLLSKPKTANP